MIGPYIALAGLAIAFCCILFVALEKCHDERT